MKTRYLILGIFVLLIMVGCGTNKNNEDNVVDELPTDAEVDDTNTDMEKSDEIPAEYEGLDTKELIKKLSEDAGLETDDGEDTEENDDNTTNTENDDSEDLTSEPGVKEISIENFKGVPSDITVNAGDTVRWTNNMDNFKQVVIVCAEEEKRYNCNSPINNKVEILQGESYEFTFEEDGSYKWGSITKFDKIYGIVTVK